MIAIQQAEDDIKSRFRSTEYCLLNKIGQGGFGSVYRAKKLSTGQYVAIKFLNVNADLEESKRKRYIDRFHREAELSSLLQHQNIVRLLDKGVCNQDLIYVVFEYIEGKSLKEILQEKTLSPPLVADLMRQVLDALNHAHERGVIHRDLKPANIMLINIGSGFHIKILDFGVATLTHEARYDDYQTITLTHETLGTPSYCAPEQLRGEPPTIKSDLYVWGLVFIECLTGKPAITGSSLASIFHKQLSPYGVPIPSAIASHPISMLLRRVLNKKTFDRTNSAKDISIELKKMNFYSLVGDLTNKLTLNLQRKSSDLDETRINNQWFDYSKVIEKKQISVLCATLNIESVDNRNIDIDVIDALYSDHQSQCIDIAVGYGGFHAGTLGDTLLIYYGYPEVTDHDSRLCTRTALEFINRINEVNLLLGSNHGINMNMQIGMHIGPVDHNVDLVPEGETINIAMKLARLASKQEIICSEFSRNILKVHTRFSQSKNTLLGVNKSNNKLFKLLDERVDQDSCFWLKPFLRSKYVGREKELDKLDYEFFHNKSIQWIHIYGEAGIGKTRLLYEFKNNNSKLYYITSQCLPEYQFKGLYPILNIIRSKYSLDFMPENEIGEYLESILLSNKCIDVNVSLPILCGWLNVNPPRKYKDADYPTKNQKQHLYDSLVFLIIKQTDLALDRQVFIIEDYHWADSSTLEFIIYLMNVIPSHHVIIDFITTSRYFISSNPHMRANIELTRLAESVTNELIHSRFNNKNISPLVIKEIISRTDGVPLFVEEIIDMFKDDDFTHNLNGIVDFVDKKFIDSIPSTLIESLQSKFNKLIHSKEIAQMMSVIGRNVDLNLLVLSLNKEIYEIEIDLKELQDNNIVLKKHNMNTTFYVFRHSLVREAIYSSIPRKKRINYHNRIARALVGKNSPSMFSHYKQGESYVEAIKSAILCVENMLNIGDFESAVKLCIKARECYFKLDKNMFELKLKINCFLISSYVSIEGNGSDKIISLANENYNLCLDLNAGSLSDSSLKKYLHQSSWALMTHYHMCSNRKLALDLALKEMGVCEKYNSNFDAKVISLTQVSNCLMMEYRLLESKKILLKAFEVNNIDSDLKLSDVSFKEYGFSAKSFPYMIASIVWCLLGDIRLGLKFSKESIRIGEVVGSPVTKMIALGYGFIMSYLINDLNYMKELMVDAKSIINKNPDLEHFRIYLKMPEAYILKDIKLFEININSLEQSGQTQWLSVYKCMQIEILMYLNKYREADLLLEDTLKWSKEVGELVCLSKLNGLKSNMKHGLNL